jgi:hypothetical protein
VLRAYEVSYSETFAKRYIHGNVSQLLVALGRWKYRKNKAPFHAVPPARGASAPLPPAGAAAARGGRAGAARGRLPGLIQRDERRCKLVQKLDERRCQKLG